MEMPLEWRVGDETKYFYADSSVQQWGSKLLTGDALWVEQAGSQVNSLINMSNDRAHVQPVKFKVEAQSHQNKWLAVIWSEKQCIYVSTLDLRCHWEHFMFPTDSCRLLHAAATRIPPNLRLNCLPIPLCSRFRQKRDLSQEKTEGRALLFDRWFTG